MDNKQQTTEALFGSQPNILFILSDDHGYSDFSFYGRDEAVHTPNLDRLRNSGMLFEQGFVKRSNLFAFTCRINYRESSTTLGSRMVW